MIGSLLPPRPSHESPILQLPSWSSPNSLTHNPSSPTWSQSVSSSPPLRPHTLRANSNDLSRRPSFAVNNTIDIESLPIAAKFLSTGPEGESPSTISSEFSSANGANVGLGVGVGIPSRDIDRTQPPSPDSRLPSRSGNGASNGGSSYSSGVEPRRPSTTTSRAGEGKREAVNLGLPEDLRKVLEVLRDGVYEGHLALSRALKARYEEQYPLVRSLADVFNQHVRAIFCRILQPLVVD